MFLKETKHNKNMQCKPLYRTRLFESGVDKRLAQTCPHFT